MGSSGAAGGRDDGGGDDEVGIDVDEVGSITALLSSTLKNEIGDFVFDTDDKEKLA